MLIPQVQFSTKVPGLGKSKKTSRQTRLLRYRKGKTVMESFAVNSELTPGGKYETTSHPTNTLVVAIGKYFDNIYIPGFKKPRIANGNRYCDTVRSSTRRNTLSLADKIR